MLKTLPKKGITSTDINIAELCEKLENIRNVSEADMNLFFEKFITECCKSFTDGELEELRKDYYSSDYEAKKWQLQFIHMFVENICLKQRIEQLKANILKGNFEKEESI